MDKTQQRYERFAELRTAHPALPFDEIMERIGEEETDAADREHYEMLDSMDAAR